MPNTHKDKITLITRGKTFLKKIKGTFFPGRGLFLELKEYCITPISDSRY
jgi:hypothetical protein